MDWSNEEYVRLYTRETADDLDLSWEAVALWRAMLTKFDRAGLMVARNGWLSVSRLVRMPEDVVGRAGPELIKDGRIKQVKGGFLAPNYVEAQTASKSDKIRQRESRDRRREKAVSQVIESTDTGHAVSHAVTPSHTPSQNVTLCSALLCDTDTVIPPVRADREPAKVERPKKAPLPDGWVPDRSEVNLKAESEAQSRGINLREELLKMRDWAKSNNAKKTDWEATWRNWTRNAKPSGPKSQTEIRNIEEL